MKKIKILQIQFNAEISQYQLSQFRGAIIEKVGRENILFHNHLGDEHFRYSYPLIQYKLWHKKPMIICVNDGTDEIQSLFSKNNWNILLGDQELGLNIESLHADWFTLQVWDTLFVYSLFSWMALNSENYKQYQRIEIETERIQFLENILKGNIISFAKGVEYTIDKELLVQIRKIKGTKTVRYKDTKVLVFDLEFQTNISLPNFIGLGKGVSLGYGMVKKHCRDTKDAE